MGRTDEDEVYYKEVGTNIRSARARQGISQSQLAKYLRLSRASIGNIENGRQRIQLHLLARIAFELKVSTHTLLPANIDTTRRRGTLPEDEGVFIDDASQSFVEGVIKRRRADREAR